MLPAEFASALRVDKTLGECLANEQDTLAQEMYLPEMIRLARAVLGEHLTQWAAIRTSDKANQPVKVSAAAMFSDALDVFLSQCQKANSINVSRPLGLADVANMLTRIQGVLVEELSTRLTDVEVQELLSALKERVRVPGTGHEDMEPVEPPHRLVAFMDDTVPGSP